MTSKQIDGKTSRQILKAADAIKYKPTHIKKTSHKKKTDKETLIEGKKIKIRMRERNTARINRTGTFHNDFGVVVRP